LPVPLSIKSTFPAATAYPFRAVRTAVRFSGGFVQQTQPLPAKAGSG